MAHNACISFDTKRPTMARIAYFRVSTTDQSIEAQRHALLQAAGGSAFDQEFKDEGISGATPAAQRAGFSELLKFIRQGDELHVYAVDRLGRDALDVQATVRALLDRGVAVEIHGLGRIARGVGELILAVLAQVADMERQRIAERTAAGREKAREALAATGRTHRGKASLGRPQAADPEAVKAWRQAQGASIATTAQHFGLSVATVKRYCGTAAG
ncbi:recombinase family protein [Azohydromonas aeria]|uniref:recombinase family protein n=1 Tax=Azohydromonas aeria TaxID=2590212 RepID=UPI001E43ACD5|nr:recombinase family protein [Azohydromonas aeria]